MKQKGQSKKRRIRSAALVRMKYLLNTGRIDPGFKVIFEGVLQDLGVTKEEVDQYIQENKTELEKTCLE